MSGTALAAWAAALPFTALAAIALLTAVFAIGVATGRHRIVDAAWGPAFALVAVVDFGLSTGHGDTGRRIIVLALTAVWGLRLAVHIARRGRGKPEDPRYEALLAKAHGSRNLYAYMHVYLLQAVLVWFISLPVQMAQFGAGAPGPLAVVGIVIWLLGMVFEAVGDWQLARFAADPANKGRLMRSGLWRYTRHPNYFGDACVWWGLFLVGADRWAGLCTILSPVVMTLLLTVGSGKPMTERHMIATRPEYADYAARTSGFIPLPPKRR